MNIIDLSQNDYDRIFILGGIDGDYGSLMRLLYEQGFTHKDAIIFTGNFLNIDNHNSVDCFEFIKNNDNCYAVKGKSEIGIQNILHDEKNNHFDKVINVFEHTNLKELVNFLYNLANVVKATPIHYAVHAGLDPAKDLFNQSEDVFHSIGVYDPESRFYQGGNSTESSWYEGIFRDGGLRVNVCFSSIWLPEAEVPAGYNLGKNSNNKVRCLILDNNTLTTSLIEVETLTGGYHE